LFAAYGFDAPFVDTASLNFYGFANDSLTDSSMQGDFPNDGPGCNPDYNCCGNCFDENGQPISAASGMYISHTNQYTSVFPPPYNDDEHRMSYMGTTGVMLGSQIIGEVAPGVMPEPDRFYRYVSIGSNNPVYRAVTYVNSYTQQPCVETESYNNSYDSTLTSYVNIQQWYELSSDDCFTTEVGQALGIYTTNQSNQRVYLPDYNETYQTDTINWDGEEPPCSGDQCCDHVCDPASTETNTTWITNSQDAQITGITFYEDRPF